MFWHDGIMLAVIKCFQLEASVGATDDERKGIFRD
jgi:hypothetical protein